MTDIQIPQAPKAHARIAFLGAVSPHWEVYSDWGDQKHTSQRPAQTNIHAMGKSSTGPVVRYLIKKYEFNYKR